MSRLGQRRYWPIYEAAAAAGICPSASTPSVMAAGRIPPVRLGQSYYIEEMVGPCAWRSRRVLTSMILEGRVRAGIPNLKVVLIEGGLAWAAVAWLAGWIGAMGES